MHPCSAQETESIPEPIIPIILSTAPGLSANGLANSIATEPPNARLEECTTLVAFVVF